MEIITKSSKETKKLGKRFAANLKGGELFLLSGDLGSGKTTFTQGFAEELGVERIVSPTFILMRKYESQKFNFYHLDLYRLEGDIEKELRNLGATDIWGNPENVVVVEWADKAKGVYPKNAIKINFESVTEDERKIIVNR